MKRKDLLNLVFWLLLILVIILVLWRILGNSPSDLSIIVVSFFTILMKLWAISDELKEFKNEVKYSFMKVKEDMGKIKGIKK